MVDFLMISTRTSRRGTIEVYPKFIVKTSSDLMIRGGDFYAIWLEDRGLWSTDEQDVIQLIDSELDNYVKEHKHEFESKVKVLYMWDSESGMIDSWHKYCQKHMRDRFKMLDEKIIFANTKTNKKDYASKKLEYPLEAGNIQAYEKIISTLYSEEERAKIEWAIGSIVTGDSKKIQKFMVFYGAAGTGKSTIMNIIQMLFDGYYSVFDAKALGSSSNSFALEAFKSNPLVAIQHDGDLSKIEDNTRLNSLVSHEMMTVNEKFKSTYSNRFKCFLFMGTNRPVKITDAKSGLIRRLIDVSPTGSKLEIKEYNQLMKKVGFELGGIAHHCKKVYLSDPGKYEEYIPVIMLGASNDFYNFVIDSYYVFKKEDGTTLKAAWEMYKTYCDEAKVGYPFSQRVFKEELKNYFYEHKERFAMEDGTRVRSYYTGFKTEKFEDRETIDGGGDISTSPLIDFSFTKSIFDTERADCPAQYANEEGTPNYKWENVITKLSDLNTKKLHYVRLPENHIVIDFDITDENGLKSFEKNLEAASKWPETYCELSKSGQGIHLHYIYSGDVSQLSRIYDDDIEVKVFTGNSSLRRKFTRCNNLQIATLNSGLPLKKESKMVNFDSEKSLRTLIKKNLNKEIHPYTKPSIDFIYKILEDAYQSGLKYDVSSMYNDIWAFASSSSNQADYCLEKVLTMKFKSEEASIPSNSKIDEIVFFDVEVFPNLFICNWKLQGKSKPITRMINPNPKDIESLLRYNLIGFNCRRYDNHILYGSLLGYTNEELFNLSQKIIGNKPNAFFAEAYNISYTDIYDFSSRKQSLKKWEIELGLVHKELGLPWDQPVPEDKWIMVAEYCDNDVIATEEVFNFPEIKGDFLARQILAEVAGLSINDTTNTLTTKLIFKNNRKPQDQFNYRDLSKPVHWSEYEYYKSKFGDDYVFRIFDENGLPTYQTYEKSPTEFPIIPEGWSILPFFKDYTFDFGKSFYLGEEIGEGGRVYSEPGMYVDVWDGDVASMHPWSAIMECLFGKEYTKRFKDLVLARVSIKRMELDSLKTLFDGAFVKYLDDVNLLGALAYALKIAINSIYGLTSAGFENAFRDLRNKDNIVAKRGALFMTLLKQEVQKLGYTVAHIKTDSIKIPNADDKIKDFILKFGKEFGYEFETEYVFGKFCLVNDAVFIGKVNGGKADGSWVATGTQFKVPYVYKKLFTNEPIVFEDLCETKAVTTALYLDMNEELDDSNHDYRFVGKVGNFCPIKPGKGGGLLMREKDGKYNAATGSKGYRWLEAAYVKELGLEENIDKSYYNALVDDASNTISKYGDIEWFTSNDSKIKGE